MNWHSILLIFKTRTGVDSNLFLRLPHNSLHGGFISLPELLIVCVLGVAEVGGAPHHNWNTTALRYYSPGWRDLTCVIIRHNSVEDGAPVVTLPVGERLLDHGAPPAAHLIHHTCKQGKQKLHVCNIQRWLTWQLLTSSSREASLPPGVLLVLAWRMWMAGTSVSPTRRATSAGSDPVSNSSTSRAFTASTARWKCFSKPRLVIAWQQTNVMEWEQEDRMYSKIPYSHFEVDPL